VFGVLGERVKSIKKAWQTCVLRAQGHEPVSRTNGKLDEARAALRADLHFHDLRHEAGSRWLEAGMPLRNVKEMLGHANISQTDTYLNAGQFALHESMQRLDEAGRGNPVANEPPAEHRLHGHDEPMESPKDLLH
jgi:integrase